MVLTRAGTRAEAAPSVPQFVSTTLQFGMAHSTALFLAATIAMFGGFNQLGLGLLVSALTVHFVSSWLS